MLINILSLIKSDEVKVVQMKISVSGMGSLPMSYSQGGPKASKTHFILVETEKFISS